MKNSLFLATLFTTALTAFVSSVNAQGLILRGGMNASSAVTDPELDEDNTEPRYGFNAAALADVPLSGAVHLVAGAGYEQRGLNFTNPGNDDKMLLSADYLSVPVMLSLRAPSDGAHLFINVGIEPAFLMSSDFDIGDITFEVEQAESFDFGLRGEVGVELPLSMNGPGVLLGLGYTYGLTDANSDEDGEWNNTTIHAFLGVKLGM
jgi:hypothetical protein